MSDGHPNYISPPKDPVGGRVRDKLRALLEADAEAGIVATSRGGKINRKYYAQQLGCTTVAFTPSIAIFAEFERRLEVVTGPLRHLPEMRTWLSAAYENKTLRIRDGKIDRTAFAAQFELRGGTFMTRHPEIRALLEDYDGRVERENYLPRLQQEELERLYKALAAGPELTKDRVTINAKTLSVVADVPEIRFRDRLFAEAISAAQEAITARVKASKIDPYFHGRVFAFSDLTRPWGDRFVERVAVRFKQVGSGLASQSSKHIYLSLFDALDWIGKSDAPYSLAVVKEAQVGGRVRSAGDWEDAMFEYRNTLINLIASGSGTDSSIDAAISRLRIGLNALSSAQILPYMATPLPGLKQARRLSSHRRSVAEALLPRKDIDDYVSFARNHFQNTTNGAFIDSGSGESDQFFASIGIELSAHTDLPGNPADAILQVLETRLEALSAKALEIVNDSIKKYETGLKLISKATIDVPLFCDQYLNSNLSAYQRNVILRNLFPLNSLSYANAEQGIANFLALIKELRDGIPPLASRPDPIYGQFYQKRYLEYGGVATIEPMLIPNADAVGAVLTLYLIESGANVSVGQTLDRKCCEPSDIPGYRRITGYKARADGKPILIDLPDTSPCIRAIDWLLSASQNLPSHAKENQDRLFLMRIGARVQLMTSHWYTNWFKSFVKSIKGLETLNLTPSMIRPSVLLHAALKNDGRLLAGMAVGQHTFRVSQGYQQKWPTRLLYDATIRRFQGAFETLVMESIPAAASKIGITEEQFQRRLGYMQSTGLGTFCGDKRGRPSERSGSCSTLDCWNDCPHLLIVAEVEAIATLQLWQASLRDAQPDWERDRPERWDAVWLPWLCLTDVVEEKMVRGPMIKIWNAAKNKASEISKQLNYAPPKPW